MDMKFYRLYTDADCQDLVGEKVIISDSFLDEHRPHHPVGWNNRLTAKISPIIIAKAEELMSPNSIKLNQFKVRIRDYIGKNRRVKGLTKLQQDVQHHYGFIPNLDDPVYNPPKEKGKAFGRKEIGKEGSH